MSLPLKWKKMSETGLAPYEYEEQHKERVPKLNTLRACLLRFVDMSLKSKGEKNENKKDILKKSLELSREIKKFIEDNTFNAFGAKMKKKKKQTKKKSKGKKMIGGDNSLRNIHACLNKYIKRANAQFRDGERAKDESVLVDKAKDLIDKIDDYLRSVASQPKPPVGDLIDFGQLKKRSKKKKKKRSKRQKGLTRRRRR